jgi:hypothetical protein
VLTVLSKNGGKQTKSEAEPFKTKAGLPWRAWPCALPAGCFGAVNDLSIWLIVVDPSPTQALAARQARFRASVHKS